MLASPPWTYIFDDIRRGCALTKRMVRTNAYHVSLSLWISIDCIPCIKTEEGNCEGVLWLFVLHACFGFYWYFVKHQ